MNREFVGGADESLKDKRTIKARHLLTTASAQDKGGVEYLPQDILDQLREGKCTAISLVQRQNKVTGKKFSDDFQYLLQKKKYDMNWNEGSSPLVSLKVGKKYGFLPMSEWHWTTPEDSNLPYSDYIAKLQAIPDSEIERLITLCTDKLFGYAQVDVINPQEFAKQIDESKGGLICRFVLDENWWTDKNGVYSQKESDISPLRPPTKALSGHQVITSQYDLTMYDKFTIPNTWGIDWCRLGCADYIWEKYKPTEAWLITPTPVIRKFNNDLSFGMSGLEVMNLQNALKILGFFDWNVTGYFGPITYFAVKAYQKANKIDSIGRCGPITRAKLNLLFNL